MGTAKDTTNRQPPDVGAAERKKKNYTRSTFPLHRVEDILQIAEAIEANNAGQPYPPMEIAGSIGRSPGSTGFHALLSSSLKYGLTTGSYKSDRIALTPLGRVIVAPTSAEERAEAMRAAVLSPEKFAQAYEYFKGKKLPDTQYLMNIITREFDVPAEHAEPFAEVFRANLHYVGLLREIGGSLWVADSLITSTPSADLSAAPEEAADDGSLETSEVSEVPPVALVMPTPPEEPKRPKAIFIGHGPDKVPLTQLTKILDEWGLPYKVAEYEPNAGRPISQKVADLMDECGAAILIFTPDRELRDLDGDSVWLSSANVAHELGAASVLYEGRVVVFKEAGVDLASNYSGIGYIEFEKNKLSAHAMELFREIQHFGLIKIIVGA